MHNKYLDLFETLIKAYYEGNFDETLTNIMACHEKSPQETFEIITSLCGVDLKYDNNYVYNLKKAITNYTVNERIVKKLEGCVDRCPQNHESKYPCQRVCPFNAIYFDEKSKSTKIDSEKCADCGICIDACKDGKLVDQIQFIPIANLLKENKTVVAIVAPAIIGQFGEAVTIDQLRAAVIKLGFTDMIEVAFAADVLTIKEAVEFKKHVKGPKDLLITSCCCPMWVGMLKKVYTNLIPNLSPSVSPMIAAGRIIKKLNKNAKVVFIGPCIAKKAEANEKDLLGAVDFVLTFQEIDEIFKTLNINPKELKGIPTVEYASRGGRLYARTGGVSIAIRDAISELYPESTKYFKPLKAEGVSQCKAILKDALTGSIDGTFIEGMGCVGGCVGGPKTLVPPKLSTMAVDNFAYDSAVKVPTHSTTLDKIFESLDITSLKDFEDESKISMLEREF